MVEQHRGLDENRLNLERLYYKLQHEWMEKNSS